MNCKQKEKWNAIMIIRNIITDCTLICLINCRYGLTMAVRGGWIFNHEIKQPHFSIDTVTVSVTAVGLPHASSASNPH